MTPEKRDQLWAIRWHLAAMGINTSEISDEDLSLRIKEAMGNFLDEMSIWANKVMVKFADRLEKQFP